MIFLQIAKNIYEANSTSGYIPIILQIIIVSIVVLLIVLGTHILGPRRKTKQKLINFECGIEQRGNARQPVSIKYFLVAILFVLFDVEIIFFYPYAINFKDLGWFGFYAVATFVLVFLIGFYYIIRTNALKWED